MGLAAILFIFILILWANQAVMEKSDENNKENNSKMFLGCLAVLYILFLLLAVLIPQIA